MADMRPELANALVEAELVDVAMDGLAPVPDLDLHGGSFVTVEGRQKLVEVDPKRWTRKRVG
jgi:hypothetical protein